MPAALAALAAASWLVLALWSASPYARYVDHVGWSDVGFAAALCRAIPAGDWLVPALAHAAAWLLMIAAMMLPTTLPVMRILAGVVAGRSDARECISLAVAGYAAAWIGFGLVAHALDAGLLAAARSNGWLVAHGWVVGAAVVALAGAFQFTALKYRCLEKCRTPYGFVVERWRGRTPRRDAWRIGFEHGRFCVGCCWALMLLMFVVGTASIGWMLALAALMAAEKNLPGGKRLAKPLGAGLLAWAGAIALSNA